MGLFSFLSGEASAAGDFLSAGAYSAGAKYAAINEGIAREAGRIKEFQTNRAIFQTLGQQRTAYAGGGLKQSGTAIDVYRNSVSQGALERAIVQEQTEINVTGYQEQESMFKGMAAAATAAGTAGVLGGIAQLFNPFSG